MGRTYIFDRAGIIFIAVLVFTFYFSVVFVSAADQPLLVYRQKAIVPQDKLTLSHDFSVSLQRGSSVYSYPFEVPNGVNGLQPDVRLTYNHQRIKGAPRITGAGWVLSQNYVERVVDGDHYDPEKRIYFLHLNGETHELIDDESDSGYTTKRKNFWHIEKFVDGVENTHGEYFVVRTKDGTTYRFGYTDNSELTSNLYSYPIRWSLDLVNDTYNNTIHYTYDEDPHTNDIGTVYPKTIAYNNDKSKRIDFTYTQTDRDNLWETYSQGSKIKYSRLLSDVTVTYNDNVVRRYALLYKNEPHNVLDLLTNITVYGMDNSTSLPPVTFEYNNVNTGWTTSFDLPIAVPTKDDGYRFIDVNNDGFVDMIRGFCDNADTADCDIGDSDFERKAWINDKGNGWIENNSWLPPIYFSQWIFNNSKSNVTNSGVQFGYLNDDGFIDIVHAQEDEDRQVWMNNGSGWDESSMNVPVDFIRNYTKYEDTGVRLIDVNGDNLADIVFADQFEEVNNSNPRKTWLNQGGSWSTVPNENWTLPTFLVAEADNLKRTDASVRFLDFNADGLIDIIDTREDKAWINNGTGWVEDNSWFPSGGPSVNFYTGPGDGENDGDLGWRITDVNGDGMIDFVKSRDDHDYRALINTNGKSWSDNSSWHNTEDFVGKFAGVDSGARPTDIDGDGLIDIIGDGAQTRSNNAVLAYFLTDVHNGIGGVLHIEYARATEFENYGNLGFNVWVVSNITNNNSVAGAHALEPFTDYNYAGGYYDYEHDMYRGFAMANETIDDKTTAHYFFQDEGKDGLEYKTEVFNAAGVLFSRINYTYSEFSPISYDYFVVLLEEVREHIFTGTSSKEKLTVYDYDERGNIIFIDNERDTSISSDDSFSYFEYSNNTEKWIIDKVKRGFVMGGDNTTKLSETNYSYDNQNFGDDPTHGDVTKEEQWYNNGDNIIIERGYNTFGNQINETDANGGTTFYEYEDSNVFIDKATDPKGLITLYEYDLGLSKVTATRNSNGVYTNTTYDVFGRTIQEIEAYDSTTYPTKNYTYYFDGVAPEYIKVSIREQNGTANTYDEFYFYDGFGNVIQTKREARNNQEIVYDLFYDNESQVIGESNAYVVTATGAYSTPNTTVPKITYEYDVLNRLTGMINQDGTNRTLEYDLWNITYTDENGNTLEHELDADGNIIIIVEHNTVDGEAEEYTTTYTYDRLGNLVRIIDNEGNEFNFSYDSLRRKTNEFDPNVGVTSYGYDANGNVVWENRAYGGLVSDETFYREYNELGQVVSVRLDNASGTIVEEYVYDGNGERIKSYNPITNTTIYTPFKEFMQIRNSSGTFNFTYIYEGEVLVAKINPDGSKHFYHPDHLGSTSLITDEAGAVVEDVWYYPYGKPGVSESNERKLYEGQEYSSAIQEYDFNFRNYDPGKGMFTKADNIFPDIYDPQQLNKYAFERGNPYGYTDPTGNCVEPVSASACAAGAGTVIIGASLLAKIGFDYIIGTSLESKGLLPEGVGSANEYASQEFYNFVSDPTELGEFALGLGAPAIIAIPASGINDAIIASSNANYKANNKINQEKGFESYQLLKDSLYKNLASTDISTNPLISRLIFSERQSLQTLEYPSQSYSQSFSEINYKEGTF